MLQPHSSMNNSPMNQPSAPSANVSWRAKKITRNRAVTSCSECTRRKQKCSRTWPCTFCLSRKSPHLCQFAVKQNAKDAQLKTDIAKGNAVPTQSLARKEPDHEVDLDSSDMVLGLILGEDTALETPISTGVLQGSQISHEQIMKFFPCRKTVDLLVQHFLAEVNWIAEEIHAPSFLPAYNSWWTRSLYNHDTDVQFGILILRLCINALQYLPHPKGPKEDDFDGAKLFDEMEIECRNAAIKLVALPRQKPTILRVQHLLFHIVTLLNDGNAGDSYQALADAVKEGQGIDLFVESRWKKLTEFEKEERRRVFWYLYIWDRFYCTVLGKWPLIPDHYHSIQYPNVLFNFKLTHHMASVTCAPALELERFDPTVIASHAEAFEVQFLQMCPPCLRFDNPDKSWDTLIPTLPLKRQTLYIFGYGTVLALHKCFVGPLTTQSLASYLQKMKQDSNRVELIQTHRLTLASTCIKALQAAIHLHSLMGGGSHRWFVLTMASIEASAMLGMLVISDHLLRTSKLAEAQKVTLPLLDETMLRACQVWFHEGLKLHRMLAQRSVLAQKGDRVLAGLKKRLQDLLPLKESLDGDLTFANSFQENIANDFTLGSDSVEQCTSQQRSKTGALAFVSSRGVNEGGNDNEAAYDYTAFEGTSNVEFMELEWEAICAGNDYSWFLDDPN